MLSYLFWPNPGNAYYSSPSMLIMLAVGVGLIVLAVVLRFWRQGLQDAMRKKLSRSWPATAAWFGLVLLFLVVARVEQIQFFAMRVLVLLWAVALLLAIVFHARRFRSKYYEIIPTKVVDDPREQYLPKKRKR